MLNADGAIATTADGGNAGSATILGGEGAHSPEIILGGEADVAADAATSFGVDGIYLH